MKKAIAWIALACGAAIGCHASGGGDDGAPSPGSQAASPSGSPNAGGGGAPAGSSSTPASGATPPTSAPGCTFTITNATGTLPAVPASAIGPTYPCAISALYNETRNTSAIIVKSPPNTTDPYKMTPIPNSDFSLGWMSPAFDLLGADFGLSPGIVLRSGDADTNAPIVGLNFDNASSTVTKNIVVQGFGADWINPKIDPTHGPLQQGDWSIQLDSLVPAMDKTMIPNGDTVQFYRATGSATFDMIWFKVGDPSMNANLSVKMTFVDAFTP